MRKSKIFTLIASTIAAGLLLTACGSAAPAGSSASASSAGSSAVSSAASSSADKKVIIAATGGQPKPYSFVNDKNEPDGYDTEFIKLVFEQLPQYELKVEVTDFQSIFTGLTAGKYQIGYNSFTYNPKRAESYLYSFPYDLNAYVVVQKKGAAPIDSFEKLAGKSFETGASNAIANGVEKWNEDNPSKQIKIDYTEADTTVLLQHVDDGSKEFTIMDPAMFKVYTEEFGFKNLQATNLDEVSTKFISDNLNAYFLFPKDQDALRQEINVVVKKLHDDGTIAKLTKKWFDRELVPDDKQYEKTLN